MKYFLLILTFLISQSIAHEGQFTGAGYSGTSVTHRSVHHAAEIYLVCNYAYELEDWIVGKNRKVGQKLYIKTMLVFDEEHLVRFYST